MPYAFFEIPSHGDGPAVGRLNALLRNAEGRVLDRVWTGQCWAICVEYREADSGQEFAGFPASGGQMQKSSSSEGPKPPAVDYREKLPPEQFSLFDRLREVRKKIAEETGLKPFVVFTNAQLAEIVAKGCRTVEDLQKIERLGNGRIEKYGPRLLTVLNQPEPAKTAP